MNTALFSFIGTLLLSLSLAMGRYGVDLDPNCTTSHLDSVNMCKTKHLGEHLELVEDLMTLGAISDPFNLWNAANDPCSHHEIVGAYVECVYEKYEGCLSEMNSTSLESFPTPSNAKMGFLSFCEQKIELMKELNETEVETCFEGKKDEVQSCENKAAEDNKVTATVGKCMQMSVYSECLAVADECTGGEAVFSTYAAYFEPEHCGACHLSVTLTLMVMTLLAAIFN